MRGSFRSFEDGMRYYELRTSNLELLRYNPRTDFESLRKEQA